MNIILSSSKEHQGKILTIGRTGTACVLTALLLLPVFSWVGGIYVARHLDGGLLPASVKQAWRQSLGEQHQSLQQIREDAGRHLEALTVRMAEIQGRLLRIDALGERMAQMARFDSREFDFTQMPPLGGPESVGKPYRVPDFSKALDRFELRLRDREQQLAILDTLLVNRKLLDEVSLAGKPTTRGWVSSGFGHRTDPFNGTEAWHNGIDFAGQMGTDVVAVASGVVTWSGERPGYGLLVEISHGGGFVTRYGHNQGNAVQVGDVVKRGQVIATMGSSGRSTGPHVHFEVHKNGQAVDPASYIDRPRAS